jgi:DNA invertase Pin-like site-specific DNA recombinase
VSTRHQLDNDRYVRAIDDMLLVMQRYGADIVIYDEGGTARSGGTIRGRKVFMAMLADVANGELDGIAAPDVRSLSRGEWMIDGKTIADTLIRAGALMFTRYSRLDLRNHGDLKAFQDELFYAMKERDEIRQRMYEGQAARALNVVEGRDSPWGRHRTMLGHRLDVLLDDQGRPRITNRGIVKRAWAKDPAQAGIMTRLVTELDRQPNRGALFSALYAAGVPSPGTSGWNKRDLRSLLRSPFHQGCWPLVRNPRATVWYGLDPRQESFDASKVTADCPDLAYWTAAQARRWEDRFMRDDDTTRRPSAAKRSHPHPLLGLLRCPQCHRFLVGKGPQGYVCPRGAKGKRATDPCLPVFSTRTSSAEAALRELLPLLVPRLAELSEAARESLKRRNDGTFDIQLTVLDNEERALLADRSRLIAKGLPVSDAFADRIDEIAAERLRIQDERGAAEQVASARVEAERALAGLEASETLDVLGRLNPRAFAEVLRAFVEWVEIRPLGPGRVGGELVDYMWHSEQTATRSQLMERLAAVLLVAA